MPLDLVLGRVLVGCWVLTEAMPFALLLSWPGTEHKPGGVGRAALHEGFSCRQTQGRWHAEADQVGKECSQVTARCKVNPLLPERTCPAVAWAPSRLTCCCPCSLCSLSTIVKYKYKTTNLKLVKRSSWSRQQTPRCLCQRDLACPGQQLAPQRSRRNQRHSNQRQRKSRREGRPRRPRSKRSPLQKWGFRRGTRSRSSGSCTKRTPTSPKSRCEDAGSPWMPQVSRRLQ